MEAHFIALKKVDGTPPHAVLPGRGIGGGGGRCPSDGRGILGEPRG